MLSKQEIFDKVEQHLLSQGKKAKEIMTGKCKYKTLDNLKCAVGCLIPDELYDPQIEGNKVSLDPTIPIGQILFKAGIPPNDGTIEFMLDDLQRTHDFYSVEEWPTRLKELRAKYVN